MYLFRFLWILAILLLAQAANLLLSLDSWYWWLRLPAYIIAYTVAGIIVSYVFKLLGMPMERLFGDDDDDKKHRRRHWRK